MRRAFLLAAGACLAPVVALTTYLAWPSRSPADPAKAIDLPAAHVAAPAETAVQLPIGQVVLFSSGVGYFQREGQIDGDARVDLSFPTQDINDLIKSMVLNLTVVSPKVKDGLKQALDLRFALGKTQRDRQDLERQLKDVTDDQIRLRANLKEMPPTAAAYKRYLDKFDAQETQIEKYQADINKMQDVEHQQQNELEDFLANCTAE